LETKTTPDARKGHVKASGMAQALSLGDESVSDGRKNRGR
jgi:hypothetical protein